MTARKSTRAIEDIRLESKVGGRRSVDAIVNRDVIDFSDVLT